MPKAKKQTVFDDRNPEDAKALNTALIQFVRHMCIDLLDYSPKEFTKERETPFNLNIVYDQLLALKADRDAYKTRAESIEAAFNLIAPK